MRLFEWCRVLALLVIFLYCHVPAADAATVTGKFRYRDTVSGACHSSAIRDPLHPVAFAVVRIWHRGTLPWNTWVPVGRTTTNSSGSYLFSDARSNGTSAVRVYASNYAATISITNAGAKARAKEVRTKATSALSDIGRALQRDSSMGTVQFRSPRRYRPRGSPVLHPRFQ
jgi:hypothetical protein